MAENKDRNQRGQGEEQNHESIGNQQRTTQTGAQNSGGTNSKKEDDEYTDDLRGSGDRPASNRGAKN